MVHKLVVPLLPTPVMSIVAILACGVVTLPLILAVLFSLSTGTSTSKLVDFSTCGLMLVLLR